MKYIQATCTYCNYKWKLYDTLDTSCYKCQDNNPKLEEKDTRNEIDYYQGSSPFPDKIITDNSNTRDEPNKPWYWDSGQSTKTSTLKDS